MYLESLDSFPLCREEEEECELIPDITPLKELDKRSMPNRQAMALRVSW
jgi:hypothetical protein